MLILEYKELGQYAYFCHDIYFIFNIKLETYFRKYKHLCNLYNV